MLCSKYQKHILFVTLSLFFVNICYSCTRILCVKPNQAVLVGNTMDWHEDMRTNLWIYPQGLTRNGMTSAPSIQWTSKYGSIVATAYDKATTNGMNERGFAAHILNLPGTDYGIHSKNKAGLSVLLWAQFFLDNFETVEEAVHYHQQNHFQIVSYTDPTTKQPVALHLAIEDASGDSAIIEYTNGVANVFHSKKYTIVTNEPSYDKMLASLDNESNFGESNPLPGTTSSIDRFTRARFYTKHLPDSTSTIEAIFNLLSVLENISQPAGTASSERTTISTTIWKSVSDLSHRVYYFHSSQHLNMIWVPLDKLNFVPGAPILKLDLTNPNLSGEVTTEFKAIATPSTRNNRVANL